MKTIAQKLLLFTLISSTAFAHLLTADELEIEDDSIYIAPIPQTRDKELQYNAKIVILNAMSHIYREEKLSNYTIVYEYVLQEPDHPTTTVASYYLYAPKNDTDPFLFFEIQYTTDGGGNSLPPSCLDDEVWRNDMLKYFKTNDQSGCLKTLSPEKCTTAILLYNAPKGHVTLYAKPDTID